MRYACLVYVDPAKLEDWTEGERSRLRGEFFACEAALRRSGRLLIAEGLEPVAAATTVRVREGRALALDGPAARGPEQLVRVLLIETRDLNDALRLAAGHPLGRLGSIEVRPVRREPGNAGRGGG